MIQFLADNVDQLDLALDQLAMKDRNFDRFAILLTDNIVELTLDKYAQDKKDLMQNGLLPYDPQIKKALGQKFPEKVTFAKDKLIDQTTSESIKKLHFFRNTSYHQGLRHEGVLHSLAIFYFRNTCTLLKAYNPPDWMWRSSNKISHRSMKYLGTLSSGNPSEHFMAAYERLDELGSSIEENLIADLTADMSSEITSVDENIHLIAANDTDQKERDSAVIFGQAYYEVENPRKQIENEYTTAKSKKNLLDWLIDDYNWEIKTDPIPEWRSKQNILARETNYHKALEQYCNIMTEKKYLRFRLALEDSAGTLDHLAEMESEIARGK